MYNPCQECLYKYNKQYTEECDNTCEYAHAVSKLKPYGGIDQAVKVMRGDAIPTALLTAKNIDWTLNIVNAVKHLLTEQQESK